MTEALIWFTKMLLAHLVTHFILQPRHWIEEKNARHFRSAKLYLHGAITAIFAFALTGFHYWQVAMIIFLTHILIDGWKSYRPVNVTYFVIDQLMHIVVIMGCWYFIFYSWGSLKTAICQWNENLSLWKTLTAMVFLTAPAGMFIGIFTKQWRDKIESDKDSLANAGKWIGMVERIIVLIFVIYNQYSAIGLLVAAKGIIRFSEKDRQEVKTEYLVIGTLLSIGLAIITGLLIRI